MTTYIYDNQYRNRRKYFNQLPKDLVNIVFKYIENKCKSCDRVYASVGKQKTIIDFLQIPHTYPSITSSPYSLFLLYTIISYLGYCSECNIKLLYRSQTVNDFDFIKSTNYIYMKISDSTYFLCFRDIENCSDICNDGYYIHILQEKIYVNNITQCTKEHKKTDKDIKIKFFYI